MTTSKLAAIVAGSLTLVLVLGLGAFVLRPADTQAFDGNAPALTTNSAAIQSGQTASSELAGQINQLLQARKATYEQQLTELSSRVQNGQAEIKNLEAQEQALQQQLAQLQTARTQRQTQYQQQLEASKRDLELHYAQYGSQYQEIEFRLAQMNALLGR